jgi:hypothetical protein
MHCRSTGLGSSFFAIRPPNLFRYEFSGPILHVSGSQGYDFGQNSHRKLSSLTSFPVQTASSISMPGLWLLCTGEVVDLFLDAVEIRPCTDGAVAQFNLPICPEPIKILEASQFFLDRRRC